MTDDIHIVPSNSAVTLCGLEATKVKGTSLGFTCTCELCMQVGQNLFKRQELLQDGDKK